MSKIEFAFARESLQLKEVKQVYIIQKLLKVKKADMTNGSFRQ